jgi:hypothetical protein
MGYLQVLYLIFFYCSRERIFFVKKTNLSKKISKKKLKHQEIFSVL